MVWRVARPHDLSPHRGPFPLRLPALSPVPVHQVRGISRPSAERRIRSTLVAEAATGGLRRYLSMFLETSAVWTIHVGQQSTVMFLGDNYVGFKDPWSVFLERH